MSLGVMCEFGRKTELGTEHLKLIFTTKYTNPASKTGFHRCTYFKGQNRHCIENNNIQRLYYVAPDTEVCLALLVNHSIL